MGNVQGVQVRRGLKKDLVPLPPGEFGLCTDTNELFIGSPAGNVKVATDLNAADIKQNAFAGVDGKPISVNGALGSLNANLPTAKIATISHKLDHTPICSLYSTEYAAGTQGAGEGPAGGGAVVSLPLKIDLVDSDKIDLYTLSKYSGRSTPEVIPHSDFEYGIVWIGRADNLILVMR